MLLEDVARMSILLMPLTTFDTATEEISGTLLF